MYYHMIGSEAFYFSDLEKSEIASFNRGNVELTKFQCQRAFILYNEWIKFLSFKARRDF